MGTEPQRLGDLEGREGCGRATRDCPPALRPVSPAPAGSGYKAAPTSARTRALPALGSARPLGCRRLGGGLSAGQAAVGAGGGEGRDRFMGRRQVGRRRW